MKPSNFTFKVISDELDHLKLAFQLCFDGSTASHYRVHENSLTFYWHFVTGATAFPFKMDAEGAADFARRWLHELDHSDYGREPDLDGDCGRGFCITNAPDNDTKFYSVVSIKPEWVEFHK